MIASDLFKQSLRLARITLKAGRVPSTDQLAEALTAANAMLGRWSANQLTAYQTVLETFTLVAGTKSYTIGPSGVFDTVRPQRIERANLLTSTDARQEIKVVDVDHWANVYSQATQGQPDILYNDRAFPLSTLYFNYSPDGAYPVELYSWKPFSRFATAGATYSFPSEYEEAIVYNLARRLAAIAGKQLDPDVRDIAAQSLADIEALNAPAPLMTCETRSAQDRWSGSGWDILTNRYR